MPNNPPVIAPTSVSLKINRTSAMLYANKYVRLPNGSGASSQTYLASFPVSATDLPKEFESILRSATVGRPERYKALIERIETEVLIPARRRAAEELARRNLIALENALNWATQNVTAIPEMQAYNELIEHPVPQRLLAKLDEATYRLVSRIKPNAQTVLQTANTANPTTAEERLKTLLTNLEDICLEIGTLLPESAQAFKRGYVFDEETVSLVQRNWFRTSDVIARLGSRAQFRRPAGWSALRASILRDETEYIFPV